MLKYLNEMIICNCLTDIRENKVFCNQLTKENNELKKEVLKLKEDYKDLENKYNSVQFSKKDIYTKYQNNIIKNS